MDNYRIGICRIYFETNTFSSHEIDKDHFDNAAYVLIGDELLQEKNHHDEILGMIDTFKNAPCNVETVPLLNIGGIPGGNLSLERVEYVSNHLLQQLHQAGNIDGMSIALHGAMTSSACHDLDGYFLEILRNFVGPDVPIICSLDCHAVVTNKMMNLADAFIAYRTHPHVDIFNTGQQVAKILLQILGNKTRPTMAWRKIPLITPPPDQGTNAGPLKEIFNHFISWDRMSGVVGCSLCCAQPWLNIPEQGWSAIAITNDDMELANLLVTDLSRKVWDMRESFFFEPMVTPEKAIRAAIGIPGGPVIITDSADNTGSGAPGDNTILLGKAIEMRDCVDGRILAHLPDPIAIKEIKNSSIGSIITLPVGGRRDVRFCDPVEITGKLVCLTRGAIHDDGKFLSSPYQDVGAIARIDINNLSLIITEKIVMGPQPSLYRKVGIDPFSTKIVLLKTGIGYTITFAKKARAVFRADCKGASSYNLSHYDFSNITSPIYPLNIHHDWRP